jgi:ABC-type polysaccharide/polyol phosphate transport system ATPase subunit
MGFAPTVYTRPVLDSAPSAVVVDRVSKRFWLSHRSASLKDRLIGAIRTGSRREALWALSDVSLRIPAGTTTGVIGPNGCGKSTLLQLIAGVLEPDGGRVTVSGRVTSLLELGAGFSPELTGRENVYLNASLHGVSRQVVRTRFDAIVAFAELERFIDMPVRTYSSGMYVRLGFAVAVHLDPEVVLIDEAFAVGDAHFQRKCLHTIRDFQREGRTIVLVSHDLHLVEQLCAQVMLLQQGQVVAAGAPAEVIGRYHELDMGRGIPGLSQRWGTGAVEITGVDLLSGGQPTATVRTRDALTIRLRYRCAAPVDHPVFGLAIHRDDGVHVTGPNTRTSGFAIDRVEGAGAVDYAIDHLPLLPGRYFVSAAVYDQDLITPYDHRERLVPFVVVEGGTAERLGLVELGAGWRPAGSGSGGPA